MPKPRLLLAVCCGPCATVAVERLAVDYDVTCLFWGDNLDSLDEFNRRLEALYKLTDQVIVHPYHHENWQPQNCVRCITLRLENAYEYVQKLGFDYFATSLTTSPHKDAVLINQIGSRISEKYVPSDFKKKDGFKRSVELSKQLKMYRQNYCGCVKP
ncbi:MAG: epoxyqueuosine reductase QueH [Clostridia bacterium]|nr:epoxyqueuosine reductase QueH [Clostridia bacterium]